MRLTIDLDTDQLTDRDRRVLAALVSDDGTPLVLPLPGAGAHHEPAPAGPPSPVPAPPAFMQKLGEAAAQFGRPPGAAHEARLPVVQQAGVRTRSTMPADDDVDELPADDPREDVLTPTRWGRPADRQPERSDDVDVVGVDVAGDATTVVTGAVRDGVVHIDAPDLHIVAPAPPAHADRDRVQRAILGTVDAPVRHTSP